MNENMEFPDLSGDDIEWLQDAFVSTILERRQEDIKSHRIKKEDKGKVRLLFKALLRLLKQNMKVGLLLPRHLRRASGRQREH